jgi:hypothetical protein
MIEEKFERLRSYFEDILTSLKSNSLPEIQIRSSCIRYPNDDAVSGNARFKYSFNINSDILEAHLQFLAEGHAELYINETYIDEVYVKRSGSLWLEQQRVKFLNIKDFVKPGNNIIEVKVKNYKDKAACCNVIGLIITSDGSIDIISDENWLTNNYMNPEWINAGISNEKLEITPPNFNKLRKSWIER